VAISLLYRHLYGVKKLLRSYDLKSTDFGICDALFNLLEAEPAVAEVGSGGDASTEPANEDAPLGMGHDVAGVDHHTAKVRNLFEEGHAPLELYAPTPTELVGASRDSGTSRHLAFSLPVDGMGFESITQVLSIEEETAEGKFGSENEPA